LRAIGSVRHSRRGARFGTVGIVAIGPQSGRVPPSDRFVGLRRHPSAIGQQRRLDECRRRRVAKAGGVDVWKRFIDNLRVPE
jgi:hypothetical protein